jgi:hypothetical protein
MRGVSVEEVIAAMYKAGYFVKVYSDDMGTVLDCHLRTRPPTFNRTATPETWEAGGAMMGAACEPPL